MLIKTTPAKAAEGFIDYLRRLGCSIERCDDGRLLSVSVTYPETVEDEAASIREWCESWSGKGRTAFVVDEATAL